MASSAQSIAVRLEGLSLGSLEQQVAPIGWGLFRWTTLIAGIALSLASAEAGVLAAVPLTLLIASMLLGAATTYLVFAHGPRYRLVLPLVVADVVAAGLLIRATGSLESTFLVYGLAAALTGGWLLGTWEGLVAGLAVAVLSVGAPFDSGAHLVYAVSLLAFGGLATWAARQGELSAERVSQLERLDREERRGATLRSLIHLGTPRLSGLDPTRIYLNASGLAAELFGADRIVILIADEATGELRVVHDSGTASPSTSRRFALPLSGPAEWSDDRRLRALLEERGLPADLAAPLRYQDRLLGLIALQREATVTPTRLTLDQEALAALAATVAPMLVSARLHVERMAAYRRQGLRQAELTESLLNLQTSIASMDDEAEMSARLAAGAVSALRAERAAVFLLNEQADAAQVAGRHGFDWSADFATRGEFPLLEEKPLALKAIRARKMVTCGPLDVDMFMGGRGEAGSAMAAPLLMGNEVLGALVVEARAEESPWREPDHRYLTLLAQAAGFNVKRAQLRRLANQRAAQTHALLTSADAVNSELDLPAVLERIVEQAATVPQTHVAGLLLTDSQPSRLALFFPGNGQRREISVDQDEEFFATVIASREARIETRQDEMPTSLRELGSFSSVCALPLIVGQRAVGLIVLGREADAPAVGQQEVRFLRHLAEQSALAIVRARLLRQALTAERHRDVQGRVAQMITSSRDLADALQCVAAEAAAGVEVERASVYLFDGQQYLTAVALIGFGEEAARAARKIALDVDSDPFTRDIVRQKRPVQAETRAMANGRLGAWPLLQRDLRRVVGVPMVFGERVVGALFLHERRARRVFGEDETDLLGAIARVAAAAVENDELREQTNESLQRERLLAVAGRELSTALPLTQRLDAVLQHLAQVLPLDAASIAAFREQGMVVLASHGPYADHLELPDSDVAEELDSLGARVQNGRDGHAADHFAAAGDRFQSYTTVPLLGDGRTLGILQVAARTRGAFGERELNLLTALASELASALDRHRMEEEARELVLWKQRALEARVIQDGASRALASAIVKLTATDMLADIDRDQALQELRQAKELAGESLDRLRHSAQTLGAATKPEHRALVGD